MPTSDFRQLPKRFGRTVRQSRTDAGLTQMILAERSDLTLNYVGEIERGEKLASLETIARLAHGLSLSAADLMRKAGL